MSKKSTIKVKDISSFFISKSSNGTKKVDKIVEVPNNILKGKRKKKGKDDFSSGEEDDEFQKPEKKSRNSKKNNLDIDSPISDTKAKTNNKPENVKEKNKRKKIIYSSDEDDDCDKDVKVTIIAPPTTDEKQLTPKSEKNTSKEIFTLKDPFAVSKPKIIHPTINPNDFFGSQPIVKVENKNKKSKKEELTESKINTKDELNNAILEDIGNTLDLNNGHLEEKAGTIDSKDDKETNEDEIDNAMLSIEIENSIIEDKSVKEEEKINDDEQKIEKEENIMKTPKEKKTPKAKKEKEEKIPKTPEDVEDQKKTQRMNYFKWKARGAPRKLGQKEIPVGAPDCLKDIAFVISGVLESIEREEASSIIKKYGGIEKSGVSKKVNYLIVGDEAGATKTKKANELNIPLINEDQFLDMIRKSNPKQAIKEEKFDINEYLDDDDSQENSKTKTTTTDKNKEVLSTSKTIPSSSSLLKSPSKSDSDNNSKPSTSSSSTSKEMKPETSKKAATQTTPIPIMEQSKPVTKVESWVDKYKPKSVNRIIGQTEKGSNAEKLVKWLTDWDKHYKNKTKDKPSSNWPGGKRDPEGTTYRCALLSGPPGIGKTTTAHLACKELGFDFFELNASDTRNKSGLHNFTEGSLSSKSILPTGTIELSQKHVFIMDEVDGVSGNEDRGGMQELISSIKKTKCPIICICNERNDTKIRSLANYCFDLNFAKPRVEQLRGFISSVCFKEKLKIEKDFLHNLIMSSDRDIRQILNQLHFYKNCTLSKAFDPKKDLRFGPWDVVKKVFSKTEHEKMKTWEKMDLFFQDYSIGPLFVHENYLRWTPHKAGRNIHKKLSLMTKSAEAIAFGDLIDNKIRSIQQWSLLPIQAAFSSYMPGEYMEGDFNSGIEFPQWLGKNSNRNKRNRFTQEIYSHCHLEISGSHQSIITDYIEPMKNSILKPLVQGKAEDAVNQMSCYSFIREDLESLIDLTSWPGISSRYSFDKVDKNVKSSFTRLLNKEIVPYSIPGKGTKKASSAVNVEESELADDGTKADDKMEEDDEEDKLIEKDANVKIKNKRGKASGGGGGQSRKRTKKQVILDDDDDEEDEEIVPKKKRQNKTKK